MHSRFGVLVELYVHWLREEVSCCPSSSRRDWRKRTSGGVCSRGKETGGRGLSSYSDEDVSSNQVVALAIDNEFVLRLQSTRDHDIRLWDLISR